MDWGQNWRMAELVDFPPVRILGVQSTCKAEELGPVIGQSYGKIVEQAGELDLAGPPRVYYLQWLPDSCTIAACLPVMELPAVSGDVQAKELPGGIALMATHLGPYSGLAEAWAALWVEVADKGLKATGLCWDEYVTDPGEEPDDTKWQTDLYVAVDIPKV